MFDSLIVSSSHLDTLGRAMQTYASSLDAAASYLTSRGLTEGACRGHHLGFVDEPLPGHERFAGCLSIPYVLPVGCVAIKFRRLDGDGPKYDAPAGQTLRLYNAQVLADGGRVVAICEGELDAVKVTQDLGIPAVGVPGASSWRDHWTRCFADFERVVVIADHDAKEDGSDPGLKHARKVAKAVEGDLVLPPAGLDVTEWINTSGIETVKEACGL